MSPSRTTTNLDVHGQLQNVHSGRTADGCTRNGSVITMDDARQQAIAGLLLVVLFRDIAGFAPALMTDDRLRTALILVLLRWLRTLSSTGCDALRVLHAVGWTDHLQH